jgi:hypothetical protein
MARRFTIFEAEQQQGFRAQPPAPSEDRDQAVGTRQRRRDRHRQNGMQRDLPPLATPLVWNLSQGIEQRPRHLAISE